MTCCSAGSSASASTMRSGIIDLLEEPGRLLAGDIAAKFLGAALAERG